jgi:uncharacterized protein YndB with AHSA1/START domain
MAKATEKDDLLSRAAVSINAPRSRVWAALVEPEDIKQYMFGSQVRSDWQVGRPITWSGEWQGQAYEDKGTILGFEPERRLQYSHFSPLTGQPDTPDNYHTVTIELADEGERTHVALTQDNNANAEERDHTTKTWEMMLGALKSFLEQ